MRGLVQGEQSTGAQPLLQVFCRSGQLLKDMIQATWTIWDITGASAVSRTTGTLNNTVVPAAGGVKLGTGRYAIVTGATTSWVVGTHRLDCLFQMVASGPYLRYSEFFEILSSSSFTYPSGVGLPFYTTTKRIIADAAISGTAATLQTALYEASIQIENWTGNFFEPRYMTAVFNGQKSKHLWLDFPIVAIEKIESVSLDSSGSRTAYDWSYYYWRAFNRHLDGLRSPDDRHNPKIELLSSDPAVVSDTDSELLNWVWPYGNQNIEITGVFGFLDPTPNPAMVGYGLGIPPPELHRIVSAVMSRSLSDPTLSDPTSMSVGRVKSLKTRHQAVTFSGSASSGDLYGSMSGDPIIDQLLIRLCKTSNATYIDREYQ